MNLPTSLRQSTNGSVSKSLILIVDDVPENLQVLASYLSRAGYEVLPATSGPKALNFARARLPDLILLDVSMPEMDGFEVCRCLKNMPELSNIPVLFITARTDTEDVVRGFNVGGVDYITKPFNPTELLMRVHTHLELKNARDALLKYNQELTRQGDELRQLDEEKNRLLSIVSHDMRGAFGNVISVCESLLQPDADIPREETDETLRLVMQESEHMMLLGQNLLNADAIGQRAFQLRPEAVEPRECAKFVADKHRRSAALKQVTVSVAAPPSEARLGPMFTDRNALVQILDNLVSNAVKFSPAGGGVSLEIKSDADSGRTQFSVTDNGPGLTPEDQQNLFREFASLSNRPTHGEQSVGLGLWIVKRTTEAMDGEVCYETNPEGRGASFHVLLPNHVRVRKS